MNLKQLIVVDITALNTLHPMEVDNIIDSITIPDVPREIKYVNYALDLHAYVTTAASSGFPMRRFDNEAASIGPIPEESIEALKKKWEYLIDREVGEE